MRLMTVAMQKGGSGKTTTAVNLSACLAEQGRKVLLIDLDPQRNASKWLGIDEPGEGLLDMFDGKASITDLVWESDTPGVDVVPSCKALAGYELRLSREVGAECLLREQIEKLPSDMWDYLIIDSPPTLGLLTLNALIAVREVILPVEAHFMALQGVMDMKETVDLARQRFKADVELSGILPCRVNRTRIAQDVVTALREHKDLAQYVYSSVIRENVKLAESPIARQAITQYDTNSNGAQDYRALAAEIIEGEGRNNGRT